MPIEFRCTHCQKLLRTPDDTAGKQAKCPECGTILVIPVPTALAPSPGARGAAGGGVPPPMGGSPAGAASPFGGPQGPTPAANPYQSPSAYAPAGGTGFGPAGALQPRLIDMSDILGRTWALFTQQWGQMLGMWILSALVSAAMMLVALFAAIAMIGALEELGVALAILVGVVAMLGCTWLGIGLMIYTLKVTRGQPATVGDLFSGGPYLWRVFGAQIVIGLATFVGTLLCVVPGVILGLMWSQAILLIIDRNLGVFESLSRSSELTNGNKLNLFVIWLVVSLVTSALNSACPVALIATVPYTLILVGVIYLVMSGQPTADQPRFAAR